MLSVEVSCPIIAHIHDASLMWV